jgi:hypothetical protein
MRIIADDNVLDNFQQQGTTSPFPNSRSPCIMRTAKKSSSSFQSDELADATFAAAAPLPGAARRTEDR